MANVALPGGDTQTLPGPGKEQTLVAGSARPGKQQAIGSTQRPASVSRRSRVRRKRGNKSV